MGAAENELTVELGRLLPVLRPVAWAAFSEPETLTRWWGPRGFTVPDVRWRPRTGATYRLEMQPPEGAPFALAGVFREVEPPAQLAFTFGWDPPDPDDVETLVAVSFDDRGESTALSVAQGSFKTQARRELHRDGWTQSLDRLVELLAAPGPGPRTA